jgi:hypothetical protein
VASDVPKVGQVIDHRFLWAEEQAAGQTEGRKVRPCIIIAVEHATSGAARVTVLPITSQAPREGVITVPVPASLLTRLGLDSSRQAWVSMDDANDFSWPGFDVVPQRNGGFVRGQVTLGFFDQVRKAVLKAVKRGHPRRVERD